MPAAFERATGKFLYYSKPAGKQGGSWALLDRDQLIAGVDRSGVPVKIALDPETGEDRGDVYGLFPGLDLLTTRDVVYILTRLTDGEVVRVKATLKEKIDVDFRRYVILGACNPHLAHQAISGEPFIGVLLPCNVVVMEREGGGSIVSAFKPTAGFSLVDNPDVAPIAEQVEDRLRRVLDRLG